MKNQKIIARICRVLSDIPQKEMTKAEKKICTILEDGGYLHKEDTDDGIVFETTSQ